jgi:hypothetical protein
MWTWGDMTVKRPATADMIAAQRLDLADYFYFQVERTAALDELIEGSEVRYRVDGLLAGSPFEQVVVDVGFGGVYPVQPDLLPANRVVGLCGGCSTPLPHDSAVAACG